jgi:FAD/FMN-containing dehydrogenase
MPWRSAPLETDGQTVLPFGQGRSYGDVCLNDGGEVLTTRLLDNLLHFDRKNGVLRAEAGITLGQILEIIVPAGWFIPVSPGTQFVSLGGAIANDIHGKNHHGAGTFGRHVRRFFLRRTDGEQIECSASNNEGYFGASIAGLGLTGLIVWAEIQLIPIRNRYIINENIPFRNLNEFFSVSQSSEKDFDYTVAWLDCVSDGNDFGRGIFMRGYHAPEEVSATPKSFLPIQPLVPINLPGICLNKYSVKAFNAVYYALQKRKVGEQVVDYEPFFYPLDSVLYWNRIYGARGFVQFQCVVPIEGGKESLRELLEQTVASGEASFLAVLKEFGSLESPGMLSFPRPGYTLCLDFAFKGRETEILMARLERIVMDAGGALYPAKDACMTPQSFRSCYQDIERFLEFRDRGISSTFWRRVMEEV